MNLKTEMRILGIDDGPFDKFKDRECNLIGVLYRGGQFMDGLLTTKVEVDGFDATMNIIDMVNKSKWKEHIRAIMLNGCAVAGFNVINAHKVHEATDIPVIIVTRDFPDYDKLYSALRKLDMEKKIPLIEKLGEPQKVKDIYVQCVGIDTEQAEELITLTSTHSNIPEPIRVAHLIASGLFFGESKGGA
ncbi:MAG: DUF99 family protein [Nanoarchaeota archaeon]|nr:DUF99 family protein [Nanoarchaeota archaeon]